MVCEGLAEGDWVMDRRGDFAEFPVAFLKRLVRIGRMEEQSSDFSFDPCHSTWNTMMTMPDIENMLIGTIF